MDVQKTRFEADATRKGKTNQPLADLVSAYPWANPTANQATENGKVA